jgi:hypothetical protein
LPTVCENISDLRFAFHFTNNNVTTGVKDPAFAIDNIKLTGDPSVTPLPVNITSFALTCDKEVTLNWATASEENTDKYIVEKSKDLVHWRKVNTIDASGNSNYHIDYSIQDRHPFRGKVYYRLLQIDLNGNENMYGPISTDCGEFENTVNLYPNPSTGNFIIEFLVPESLSGWEIQMMNVDGKIVFSKTVNLFEGKNQLFFDEQNIERGVYLLTPVSVGENYFEPVKVIIDY